MRKQDFNINNLFLDDLFLRLDIQRFASSFSLDSASQYQGRKLNLSATQARNTASNTSTINWTLTSTGGSSARYATGPTTVTINGVQVYYKQRYGYSDTSFPVAAGSVSGAITVAHDTNGAKTITCTLSTAIYTSTVSTSTGNWVLDSIPRGTTINTYTRDNILLNSFRVNWSSAHTVDRVEYSLNGGTWTVGQTGDRTSGNFTIGSLNPNTQYSIRIRVRRKDTGIWSESNTAYVTTLNIASFVTVPNYIDFEEPFEIIIARNGASNVNIGIFDTNGSDVFVPYREVTGNSYTFNLTNAEKNALFNDMLENNKSYRIYLNTNDNTYRNYSSRTFNIVNANPTFNNFTYIDTGGDTIDPLIKTTNLTGNNQVFIKGYSNLRATISSANKAIAIKGASMTSYQLSVGNEEKETKAYSQSSSVLLNASQINSNNITVHAIDSRNNTTKIEKIATMVEYIRPVIVGGTTKRPNGVSTETNLQLNGTFFNSSFGAVNNDLVATYKYKKTSESTFGADNPLTLSKNGNNFSFNGEISGDLDANGFDSQYSYNIQITVTDSLHSVTYNTVLGTGIPNLAIHRKGVAINGPFNPNLDDGLQIYGKMYLNNEEIGAIDFDKIYPIGYIHHSNSSENPSIKFGGTWVQLTDRFLVGAGGLYSNGATGGHTDLQSHSHTYSFTSSWADLQGTSSNSFFYGGQVSTSNGIVHTQFTSGRQYQATTTATNSWQQLHINASHNHTGSGTTASSGSGNAQNMPPYRAVNIWYRSA